MPTEIRNIITRRRDFYVSTNEDWLDGFPFYTPGPVTGTPDPGNKGNGTLSTVTAGAGTPFGLYRVKITDIQNSLAFFTFYQVTATGDQDIARGVVNQPVNANGISFTLNSGSTPFSINDGFSITVLYALQSLTGIEFNLHIRRRVGLEYLATPAVFASTQRATLLNGGALGVVNLSVPRLQMITVAPATYDYDLLATAENTVRRVYFGTVEVIDGVTRI